MNERIIANAATGDTENFRQIVETHQDMVVRTCYAFVHNHDDAQDIAQEVFVNVYLSLKGFKGQSSLSTWIYRIAVNASLKHIRDNRKHSLLHRLDALLDFTKAKETIHLPHDPTNPELILTNRQRSDAVHNAIDSLAENPRTAFILTQYDELSYQQVADIMNISTSAVDSLIHRAKSNLQKKLKDYYKKYR